MVGQRLFLVVEDDPEVGGYLSELLARHGRPTIATSVRDAMVALTKEPSWEAFFIDLGLPDGSGLEVLSVARNSHAETPALVLTGFSDPGAINAAYDLGAAYLIKPVEPARIEQFLWLNESFSARLDSVARTWRERYRLSVAEWEILHRAASGESRAVIAAARSSSVLTVKKHVGNLLQKTDDTSLQEALNRLIRETADREFPRRGLRSRDHPRGPWS
jgi:DNA-binding NarL/FixJ family response regulator